MADNATAATSGTTPDPAKKPHAKPGDVDKSLLDDIQLTKDVLAAAADPVHAAIYPKEVDLADTTALAALVQNAEDVLVPAVINAKKAALAPTELEESLRQQLLLKLRWIQGQAERTFGNDKAKRAAYLVGKSNFGRDRETFNADATAILTLAGADTLKKVDKTTDLPPIEQMRKDWNAADQNQKKLQTAASDAIRALQTAVGQINVARRDIQKGADNTFSYTDKANAAKRRAFKLQADRPFQLSGGPA